ncbi:MAG: phosphoglycerol transferase MdoB-like AlkP superfamily enzyme [Pseudomonadales bacterium]|jgi:phosphoglycerol transferase MdoB-like AlkP superfamily enzyme
MAWWNSRRIRFYIGTILLCLLMFSFLRAVFYFGFSEVGDTIHPDAQSLFKTLYVGFKFDLRLACLITLPLMVLGLLPYFHIAKSAVTRKIAAGYLVLWIPAILMVYIIDFGHYSYLGMRVNSTVLRFAEDMTISTTMMWESYPVIWITLSWITMSVVLLAAIRLLAAKTLETEKVTLTKLQKTGGVLIFGVMTLLFLLGRFAGFNIENPVPLRWNDADVTGNSKVTALGINPVLNFYDTFALRDESHDMAKVREHYPQMANYLGVKNPDIETLDYDRRIESSKDGLKGQPNIVFIMLESLGASRVGVYNNPLPVSPNLDHLAENGWLFKHFYVPVSGTAKTVFASITGLPDVSSIKTATRNPMIANQRVVLNHFKNYEKLYFIGGSAGWANMSGVIKQSIDGIKLYEEGNYTEPMVDVWGISDWSLFKEADRILATKRPNKPFIAYIQTAANHRPFTIPDEDSGFETLSFSEEEYKSAGFRSLAQLNAVHLLDYNIGLFIEMAKAGGYFENTIFIMYGDHNNRITTTPFMKPFYEELDLDGLHVPHIMYGPKFLEPKIIEEATSLVDVVPTVAGMLGLDYDNTTMGRDVFGPAFEADIVGSRAVFTQTSDKRNPVIGAITKDFMARMDSDGSDAKLHDLNSETPAIDVSNEHPEIADYLKSLALGIYETTKFNFYHNTVGEAEKRQQQK